MAGAKQKRRNAGFLFGVVFRVHLLQRLRHSGIEVLELFRVGLFMFRVRRLSSVEVIKKYAESAMGRGWVGRQ